jgi:hypothetical protein
VLLLLLPCAAWPAALSPPQAEGAKLVAKLENDIHCNHERTTFSPLYRPVPQNLDISTIAAAKPYFPKLAEIVKLEDDYPLPLIHNVWRAKIMWTVVYKGVVGEVSLHGPRFK